MNTQDVRPLSDRRPIATMDNDDICDLIEVAIHNGKNFGRDEDRMFAEAWLRGWCSAANTTYSFKQTLVIYLHNYILV